MYKKKDHLQTCRISVYYCVVYEDMKEDMKEDGKLRRRNVMMFE